MDDHLRRHMWPESLLDIPMPVSRWRRFKGWLQRRPVRPMTPREAQALINAHLSAHLSAHVAFTERVQTDEEA